MLAQVAKEMEALRGLGDREIAHSLADDLLLKALRLLADGTPDADEVEDIVAAYGAIPKWYA